MRLSAHSDVENDDLTCPITLRIFHDPVIAADGRTYERAAIVRWITEHGTSPFTRQPLNINELQADDYLRKLAAQRRSSTVSYNHDINVDHTGLQRQISTISYNYNINVDHPGLQRQNSTISYNYNINVDQAVFRQLQTMHNNNIVPTNNVENRNIPDNPVSHTYRCCILFLIVAGAAIVSVVSAHLFSTKDVNYSSKLSMNP
jgi:hypothetical protein